MPIAKRGIAEFAPTEQRLLQKRHRQLGIDPTSGQRTGVASFEPFIQSSNNRT
jgi:hypothetical protein